MRKLVLISLLALAAPAAAEETYGTAKKGYKPSGQPITNPAQPGYDPDLIVCRMEDRTGSRAKRRKVCLANHVWQRVAREGNAFANRLVEDGRSGLWGGG